MPHTHPMNVCARVRISVSIRMLVSICIIFWYHTFNASGSLLLFVSSDRNSNWVRDYCLYRQGTHASHKNPFHSSNTPRLCLRQTLVFFVPLCREWFPSLFTIITPMPIIPIVVFIFHFIYQMFFFRLYIYVCRRSVRCCYAAAAVVTFFFSYGE